MGSTPQALSDFLDTLPDAPKSTAPSLNDFLDSLPDAPHRMAAAPIPMPGFAQMKQEALSKLPQTPETATALTPADAVPGGMALSVPVQPPPAANPVPGVQQAAQGVEQMAEPGLRAKAGGASKIIGGALQASTPLLPLAVAAAPIATPLGIAAGMATQKGTEAGLKSAGVPDEYAELAGNIAGLVAGGVAGHAAGKLGGVSPEPEASAPVAKTPEAPKPDQVERVSPATPNPPTAALPTAPESPDTLNLQLQQLGDGTRKVVMFPKGTPPPANYPAGTAVVHDAFGNVYVFRPDLIKRRAIRRAAEQNRLPEILGASDTGLGAPDKSALQGEPAVVVARDANGTEVQSTATDEASAPATIAATQRVTPPGGAVSIEGPDQALAGRSQPSALPEPIGTGERIPDERPALAENTPAALPEQPAKSNGRTPQSNPSNESAEFFRGAWDLGLTPTGFQDAVDAAHRTAGQFTEIYSSPLKRAQITANEIAKTNPQAGPIQTTDALEPWTLGNHEGERVTPDRIDDLNDRIRNRPDEPIPGTGRFSNAEGESFNDFKDPLIHHIQEQAALFQRGEKILNVTHYRDIQALKAWLKKGFPADRSLDVDEMTAKGSQKPGNLFRLDPDTMKLESAADAGQDGIYFLRHGETEANDTNGLVPKELQGQGVQDAAKHEFASTQANLNGLVASGLREYGSQIPDSKLAADGREADTHVTVKYGLHGNDPAEVARALRGEGPIRLKLGKTSLFKNDEADVLKADVDSADLHRLNKKITQALPNTDTHPEYIPHATIAYLKPGEGATYSGKDIPGVTGRDVIVNHITFSGKNGELVNIPLTGNSGGGGGVTLGSGLGALDPFIREDIGEMKALIAKRNAALAELEKSKTTPAEKSWGRKVIHYFTGERDLWGARVNQSIAQLRKLVPDHTEQEALSLMRDFKNRPGELEQWRDGTHPTLQAMSPQDLAVATRNIQRLRPAIDRALKPTARMLQADKVLTDIATKTLQEGQRLGFLESSITPDEYVTHLLHPKELPENVMSPGGKAMGGKMGRRFAFAQKREYPTLLDAVADNVKPRTLNALDAFTIHGDKFATARASHLLVNEIKDSSVGKWGVRGQNGIPNDWVEVAPHAHPFQNLVPYTDAAGNAQVSRQTLMVPRFVEEALRPITDPDYSSRIPGFTKTRLFQSYLKAVQLGLSMFHATTENYMALANMGLKGRALAWRADMDTPGFLSAERDLIAHGGTTAIQGKTIEAYRSLQPGSIPTWGDIWRKAPVVHEMDAVAQKITDYTFGSLQRRFKVTDYQMKVAGWMARHLNAKPAELSAAKQSIAKEVNAVYGGLHWENLGKNRMGTEIMRAIMLAPDWTFSNLFNLRYALEHGTPASQAARMFWARSILGGLAATQAASLLFSRKLSPALTDPASDFRDKFRAATQVYMGKDSLGNDVYQNIFFKGASGDVMNLINNIGQYGAVGGLVKSMAGKAAPIPRTILQQVGNRNYMGQEIAPRGMSPMAADARRALEAAKGLAPVPLSLGNIKDMLIGPKADLYKPSEILSTLFAGTPPAHVAPPGMRSTPSGPRQNPVHRRADYSAWRQAITGKVRPSARDFASPQPLQ